MEPNYSDIVAVWSNDLEVSIKTGDAADMISVSIQREYLQHMVSSKGVYAFLIIEKENNIPIGFCRLKEVDLINKKATLGIFIGEKEYWGKGIGTESIKLILDYGFNIINLSNIWLSVFSYNASAIKVYKNCGFKEIGRRRKSIILGNKVYDEIYMDLLSEEFQGSIIRDLV